MREGIERVGGMIPWHRPGRIVDGPVKGGRASEPHGTAGIAYTPALDGDRVAVVGDIHGRADLLANLHATLDRRSSDEDLPPPLEIYLGDYIDRGPDSSRVIAMLLARRRCRPVICLRGNHEEMLQSALRNPDTIPRWLHAGGVSTLRSYDIRTTASRPPRPSELRNALPAEHRAFLAALPVALNLGAMFFVHAGVRPGVLLARQCDDDLLWIREPFLSSEANHGALIVHGHSPVQQVEWRHNRINLDTGAVHTGNLTCLLMADDRLDLIV